MVLFCVVSKKLHGAVFFPSAGYRSNTAGTLASIGSNGYVWVAVISSPNAPGLFFDSANSYLSSHFRSRACALRCVQAFARILFRESFFPSSAGYRRYSSGVLSSAGSEGYCWSSMRLTADGVTLVSIGSSVCVSSSYRTSGFMLRCVQELARICFRIVSSRLRGFATALRERGGLSVPTVTSGLPSFQVCTVTG